MTDSQQSIVVAHAESDVLDEIREVIASSARPLAEADENADIRALAIAGADLLYDDDVLIVGEGLPEPVRGRDAVIEFLGDSLGSLGAGTRFDTEILSPVMISNDLVSMIVQISVLPATTKGTVLRYRAMYTFRRGARGWRIVLEAFSSVPA